MKKLLFCITVLSVALTFMVFGAGNTTLTIPGTEAVTGEEISVELLIETTNDICSGSFKLEYDAKGLELVSCEKGTAFGTRNPTVNENFAYNTVYVGWMGQTPLQNGSLITLKFKTISSGEYSFKLQDVKLLTIDVTNIVPKISLGKLTSFTKTDISVSGISIKDNAGKETESLENGKMNLQMRLDNNGNEMAYLSVIIGYYTSYGICSRIEEYEYAIEKQFYDEPDIDFNVLEKDACVKIFIWQQSNMKPVCDSISLYR